MLATEFKNIISKHLAKQFSDEYLEGQTHDMPVNVAQMASLLDPRFKILKFKPSEQIKSCIQSIVPSKIYRMQQFPNNKANYVRRANGAIL